MSREKLQQRTKGRKQLCKNKWTQIENTKVLFKGNVMYWFVLVRVLFKGNVLLCVGSCAASGRSLLNSPIEANIAVLPAWSNLVSLAFLFSL